MVWVISMIEYLMVDVKHSKISVSFGYIQDSDRPLWADTPLPSSHPTDKENVMRVRNKLFF